MLFYMIYTLIMISKLRWLVFLITIKTGSLILKGLPSMNFFHPSLSNSMRPSCFLLYLMVVTPATAPSCSPALPWLGRSAFCTMILGSSCVERTTYSILTGQFIPNMSNLFIEVMDDVNGAAAAATATAATTYVFCFFLFDMLIEFQLVVVTLDRIFLSTILV